jgi:hypothetical protein
LLQYGSKAVPQLNKKRFSIYNLISCTDCCPYSLVFSHAEAKPLLEETPLKTLLDTGEMLYYDEERKVHSFGGERTIDVEIEKIESF